jgi:prepilin-type N-terminal cleavage/methylation domain-containing protein
MLNKTFKGGFSLIELLVVIAIIGVLVVVFMASLDSTQNNREDAAVKSSLNNVRAEAALFYDDNGDYSGFCESDTADISSMLPNGGVCRDADDFWIAYAPLVTASSSAYCVDSKGSSVTTEEDLSAVNACE